MALKLRDGFLNLGLPVFLLDGDEMRSGLCSDLGFTTEARAENHRRIAEVAKLAAEQGFNVVVATMAPQHGQRDVVAEALGRKLVWIYVHASLDVCIQRDPKGLYSRARAGKVQRLTEFPFDAPRPEERANVIDTVAQDVDCCYASVLEVALGHINQV